MTVEHNEFKLLMNERGEGTPVLEGINFTHGTNVGAGRLHLDYRKDLGEKILCIHIAIPHETPLDPRTWAVFEDFFKKPQGEV
mgnify:CR=1 FL=1